MANKLTTALLLALSNALSKIFNSSLATVETNYEKIATVIDVKTKTVTYAFLGGFPKMREWIGDRVLKDLTAYKYSITNKKWEVTIEEDVEVIEHDELGIVKIKVQQMAHDAKTHYDELVFPLLETNGDCYDGEKFFSAKHPVGKTTMSNIGDKALNQKSFMEARGEMRGITSDEGKSLKIKPNLLVVPPELEQVALEILKKDFLENGESNITKGICEYIVSDELTDDKAWYLMDTKRPLKPIILQRSKKITFVSMNKEDDEGVFMRDSVRYGVSARDNSGYGLWQLAYKSTGDK